MLLTNLTEYNFKFGDNIILNIKFSIILKLCNTIKIYPRSTARGNQFIASYIRLSPVYHTPGGHQLQ